MLFTLLLESLDIWLAWGSLGIFGIIGIFDGISEVFALWCTVGGGGRGILSILLIVSLLPVFLNSKAGGKRGGWNKLRSCKLAWERGIEGGGLAWCDLKLAIGGLIGGGGKLRGGWNTGIVLFLSLDDKDLFENPWGLINLLF